MLHLRLMLAALALPLPLLTFLVSPIQAQTATPSPLLVPTIALPPQDSSAYQQAQNDYQYQLNQYRDALDQYQLAKNRYLQFHTLTTKQETLDKIKQLLKNRDLAVKTYFFTLAEKLKTTPGTTPLQQARFESRLEKEITFLTAHYTQVDSFATLEDAFKSSQEFDSRYSQMENLSYETLHLFLTGNQLYLKDQIQDQITATQDLLARLKSQKDTTKEQRWALEAQNRLLRHQEKLNQTTGQLQDLLKATDNKPDRFPSLSLTFEEANQYLKEAVSNLKETLKEVKRG